MQVLVSTSTLLSRLYGLSSTSRYISCSIKIPPHLINPSSQKKPNFMRRYCCGLVLPVVHTAFYFRTYCAVAGGRSFGWVLVIIFSSSLSCWRRFCCHCSVIVGGSCHHLLLLLLLRQGNRGEGSGSHSLGQLHRAGILCRNLATIEAP